MDAAQILKILTSNRRAWRTLLVLVFVLPVLLVLPHARSLIVRNAVITAYLGEIKAPINGRIEEIALTPGTRSKAGELAMSIRNQRISRTELARLEVQRRESALAAEQARAELDTVKAMAAARDAERDAFVQAVNQDLTKKLQMAQSDAPARVAELKAAKRDLERARTLIDKKLASPADLEAADAAYQAAVAAKSANELMRERLQQQLAEIQHGVFQIDVPDGVLLTRQMAQQVDLEVVHLTQALNDREAAASSAAAEYQAADRAYRNASGADIELAPGLTLWNVYATQGSWVTEGTTVMSVVDCSRLMADIAVDDATLELIKPGQKVRLRLFGTFEYHSATVMLVRGSAGLSDTPVLATAIADRGDRKGRVLARVDDSALAGMPGSSCGIGRTAYAEFEGISLLQTFLYPLFR